MKEFMPLWIAMSAGIPLALFYFYAQWHEGRKADADADAAADDKKNTSTKTDSDELGQSDTIKSQ